MEPYLLALIPVLATTFLGSLGWVLTRMVKLSEAVATCVEKVDAINVNQQRLDERLDNLVISRWQS